VATGEVVAILGPSGSGKTSLLRLVLGLVAPSSGAVSLDGGEVSRSGRILVPAEERGLAVVQDLALWPHLTVAGNLAFGLASRGVPRRDRSVPITAMLERVGLKGSERRYPGELSGGERQRVAIARALVVTPRAVLLDEPLSNVDVELRREILSLFRELFRERSLTVLYVTHDLREAAEVASRFAVLEGGRIIQDGRLADLKRAPATALRACYRGGPRRWVDRQRRPTNLTERAGLHDRGEGVMTKRAWMGVILGAGFAVSASAQTVVDFEKDKPGSAPAGFQTALTGSGKPGVWTVVEDETAPSGRLVLAQTDADPTGYRFPLCVLDGATAKDAAISVKFKAISGQKDQGAGIVWRYRDHGHYYVVRANALENNVVLYKMEGGKRTDLPLRDEGRTYGKKVTVPSGTWNTLGVTVKESVFEVTLNGTKLYDVEDTTFPYAGKVGLWTKADSVIRFDDFKIAPY
jgi:ABC-type nitrate/sulfonate/bicarbonate transport system ATPase subunit